ncbi:alanine racemase [Corynebacterium sp. CCM 9185]|uniref:Alanine racemase n=1 Tax=Corynebacterium marambiense TaxID=2765364 RepID=A0ABS0VRN4_9CORY|nr:alanine racemase [Corynebacterium marambiense]MBI8999429.1 alanine racemase [Corynebacterium marambiense]MCK7662267.1 alanine racemase [Corynebacterium marambiense]MCX7541535.1 alanine racemase [Corynebacterium marambiense]
MNLLTARIDLAAIAYNTRLLKKRAGAAQLMAVVKADGYNHGAAKVAQTIAANGADQFGVATLAEAHELRAAGITQPILSWIWTPEQDLRAAISDGIDLGVSSVEQAHAVVAAARACGRTARVTVKADTGLHRAGVPRCEWNGVFGLLADAHDAVNVTGIFSHLACADEPGNPENNAQAQRLKDAIAAARETGLNPSVNHLANTPAVLTRDDLGFDMVRPGLALYGLEPVAGWDNGLRPAMTLAATVTVVKPVDKGEGVSYGLTWRAGHKGVLAVVSMGYADGLARGLAGTIEVTINGHRYPQVGVVCMDQIVIDLGSNPHGVTMGDEAVIFGPGTSGEMTAYDLARALDTIPYEIICRPHGRVVREYVGQ